MQVIRFSFFVNNLCIAEERIYFVGLTDISKFRRMTTACPMALVAAEPPHLRICLSRGAKRDISLLWSSKHRMADKHQKSRKFRFTFPRRERQREAPSPQSGPVQAPAEHSAQNYRDRERTIERYIESAKLLKESIAESQGHQWGLFGLPDLNGKAEDFDDTEFAKQINGALMSRKSIVKDRKALGKCQQAAVSLLIAMSPFAKNFLLMAQSAQSVSPYFCCSC